VNFVNTRFICNGCWPNAFAEEHAKFCAMQECPRHGVARHWPSKPTLLVPVPDEQLVEGLHTFLAAYGDRYDMTLCHFQLDGVYDAQTNIHQIEAMYFHEPSALQSRYDPPALCGDPIILIAQLQAIRDNARSFSLAEGCPAAHIQQYMMIADAVTTALRAYAPGEVLQEFAARGIYSTRAAREAELL
jgi:hypothetical protein